MLRARPRKRVWLSARTMRNIKKINGLPSMQTLSALLSMNRGEAGYFIQLRGIGFLLKCQSGWRCVDGCVFF